MFGACGIWVVRGTRVRVGQNISVWCLLKKSVCVAGCVCVCVCVWIHVYNLPFCPREKCVLELQQYFDVATIESVLLLLSYLIVRMKEN